MDAITSFSYKPLRLSFALFFFATFMSVVLGLSMFVPKNPVITVGLGVGSAVFFVGGLLLLTLGVLGEYVGRVYDEVRSRPLSLISRVHRFPAMLAPQVGIMSVQSENYQDRKATEAA
jgi:dolichol-phosphate mannosyltransferase